MGKPVPCSCNAYAFPHRPGSGACDEPMDYCAECGSVELHVTTRQWTDEYGLLVDLRCLDCGAEVLA